jgi:hypothetical protein
MRTFYKIIILILLFFLILVAFSHAQQRYELQCNSPLIELSHMNLVDQIGVKEKTGHNDGAKIKEYLNSVGLSEGYPYCAAGQYWCYYDACIQCKWDLKTIPICKTGSSQKMYDVAKQTGKRTVYKARTNDLIVWRNTDGSYTGHIERIIIVGNAGWVTTVGFNTSSGTSGSQSDGQGVFKRYRNIYHILYRLKVRGLIGCNY